MCASTMSSSAVQVNRTASPCGFCNMSSMALSSSGRAPAACRTSSDICTWRTRWWAPGCSQAVSWSDKAHLNCVQIAPQLKTSRGLERRWPPRPELHQVLPSQLGNHIIRLGTAAAAQIVEQKEEVSSASVVECAQSDKQCILSLQRRQQATSCLHSQEDGLLWAGTPATLTTRRAAAPLSTPG